jgi:hypothetical protein
MRFPPPLRKAVVTAHVVTSVGWLGAEAVLLVLAASVLAGADPGAAYPAAWLIGWTMLGPLSVAAWVVGVVSAIGTPWGLLRYRWVVTKLALTTVMTGLVVFRLLPNLRAAADLYAPGAGGPLDGGTAAALPQADRVGLLVASSVATALLVFTTAVSVYKPWGRVSGSSGDGRRRKTQDRNSTKRSTVAARFAPVNTTSSTKRGGSSASHPSPSSAPLVSASPSAKTTSA